MLKQLFHSTHQTKLKFLPYVGDPAIFGNLLPHPAVTEALQRAVESQRYNGMAHSAGVPEVRESVARQLSRYPSKHPLSAEVSKT